MNLHIASTRPATDHEWDTMWVNCPYATYYHSREWAEIWQTYSNNNIRPKPILIQFSDGKEALLPFSQQNYYYGIIKRYSLTGPPAMALPYYGNWIADESLTGEHTKALSEYLIRNYRNFVWRLNPFDANSNMVFFSSKYVRRKHFVSYMIDLTRGEDYIFANMKKSCRNQIKQGMKNNLVVTEGTDIGHWKEYYAIYKNTIARWGRKTLYILDWKFFELLFTLPGENRRLWLTWYNNIPVAGCICLYSHHKILIWHSASLTKYLHLRPVNLARFQIISDGIAKKYRWLDFDTAGRNKGLEKFKKSFGPEEKMCDMIISWHPIIYNIKKYFY